MTYCDVSDVRERLPDVTADVISDYTVMYFINDAESQINDRLRGVYSVPFDDTNVPVSIKNLCSKIATYLVLQNFPDQTVEEDLERLKNDTRELLDGYVKGKYMLSQEYLITGTQTTPTFTTQTHTRYDELY